MDDFKDVLRGQSFRERTWPIVKSSRAYDDMVPWLKANRCPYIYDDESVKTANEDGIYRYDGGVYEGEWKDGKKHGRGRYKSADGDVYEGCYKDDNLYGQCTATYASGAVYEGGFEDGKRHGKGKTTWANGDVFEGGWNNGWVRGLKKVKSAVDSTL